MRQLLISALLLIMGGNALALSTDETNAEMVCIVHIDMSRVSGRQVGDWDYKPGYEICKLLYEAIQRRRKQEEEATARETEKLG